MGEVNGGWILISAYLVFFMHAGFCMVEVGCVRAKNAKNTVIMTLLDAAFAAIGFYLTGFAFAWGDNMTEDDVYNGNGFIGTKYFALADFADWHIFLFQYAFATTATTIVSGAVAERCRFEAYIFYGLWMSMWVYPLVAHWAWSPSGWASPFQAYNDSTGEWQANTLLFGSGIYDFAGSAVVHLVGGCASFWAALALGPRIGRFDGEGKPVDMPGHNMSFFILGVFILWFGWYGFNPGSQLGVVGGNVPGGNLAVTGRAAVNTTLGASFGLVGGFLGRLILEFIHSRTLVWDVMCAGNGTLAGLAAITAGCATVQPWGACIIGLIAGFVYLFVAWLMLSVLKVDDPVEAIAIHGGGGLWGCIATGLFANKHFVTEAYGTNPSTGGGQRHYGWWMGDDGRLLACMLVFVLVVIGWVSAMMAPFFFLFKATGFLRVSAEMERAGLDASHHGGSAYNMTDFNNGPAVTKPVAGGGGGNSELSREVESLKRQLQMLSDEVKANGAKATV